MKYRLTKLSDDKFNGRHPNFINEGYIEEGNDISGYHPVVYDPKTCQFCIDNSFKKNGSSLVNIIEYFGIDNIEVVGNIYQTPELLPSGSIYGCY